LLQGAPASYPTVVGGEQTSPVTFIQYLDLESLELYARTAFTTSGRGVVVYFFASLFESTGFISRPGYRNLDLGVVVSFISFR
jgi:hypothetical protein